ncbi:hypothetical protein [Escherichia phage vB_EcoM_EP57]|nr:hypothetical protein [Escherichia phage vB_EcoM_EP57]
MTVGVVFLTQVINTHPYIVLKGEILTGFV